MMSCRRAFEIDLAGFLLAPRDAAWHDFRVHYPGCADCAAEVAAWTALDARLAQPHPDEEQLLRWSDAPDSLDAMTRARLARHLERCPSCRDELRALGGFAATLALANEDPAAAGTAGHAARAATDDAASSAAPPHHVVAAQREGRRSVGLDGTRAARPRSRRRHADGTARTPLGTIGRILLHPAVAYAALVVVLLLPSFRGDFDESADHDLRKQPERFAAREAPASARAPALPPQPAAAPPSEEEAATALRFERQRLPAPHAAEPQAAPPDARSDSAAPRLEALAEQPARAPGPAAARPQARSAKLDDAPAAGGAADASAQRVMSRAAIDAPSAARDAVTSMRLDPARDGGVRTLVITLAHGARENDSVEVRVRDEAGLRELRERLRIEAGTREVALDIPTAWLAAERYVVEVYADGGRTLAHGIVPR